MKNTSMFTTTISPPLLSWLDDYSKKHKVTKRFVLEEALLKFKNEERQKELAISFNEAAKDQETIRMAEEGLEDYNNQLKS